MPIYYFDGSDAAATDPNTVWNSESNLFDGLLSTSGNTATQGSTASNYTMAEGTNAPASGSTIDTVQARIELAASIFGLVGEAVIYTDALGEALGTLSVTADGNNISGSWTILSTPSGGWTWAKLQALEVKVYKFSGGGSSIAFNQITLEVNPTNSTKIYTTQGFQ